MEFRFLTEEEYRVIEMVLDDIDDTGCPVNEDPFDWFCKMLRAREFEYKMGGLDKFFKDFKKD